MNWGATRGFATRCASVVNALCWGSLAPPRYATWRPRCPRTQGVDGTRKPRAQFIAVCSSAKPCEIGENLLSVSDPISRPEERLSHVGARIRPPTLQRRPVSRLHPYITMERSATPVSPVPEPQRRSVGRLSLPAWLETLPLLREGLQAHLQ